MAKKQTKKKTSKTTRKTPRKPSRREASETTSWSIPAVRVRMYRQGLGDCFLLTFDVGGNEKHMLIDCGALGNATTKHINVSTVVDHIRETTKDVQDNDKPKLEIIVATHAHQDHVSGFRTEKEKFQAIEVSHVWMPWTEDPADALASKLSASIRELHASIAAAARMTGVSDALRERIMGVLSFDDALDTDSLAMGKTIASALDILRELKDINMTYHSPGKGPVELPSIPGFRFYVLGPPRDEKRLGIMGKHGDGDLYGLASAARAHSQPQGNCPDVETPFDARYRQPMDKAGEYYPHYADHQNELRKIDHQWLQSLADMAVKLDNVRNNTSLALAIERIADGRVLLFPADAQLGNWTSWHDPDMKWTIEDERGRKNTITAADLLKRTVFYKVGHHGSHNATASTHGLEIMRQNPELVAFIPVDREFALSRSPKGSWRMPAFKLYRELLEACNGRVIRADLGWADDAGNADRPHIERELNNLAEPEEWRQWKRNQHQAKRVREEKMYFEFKLE